MHSPACRCGRRRTRRTGCSRLTASMTSAGDKSAGLHLRGIQIEHHGPDLAADDHRRHGPRLLHDVVAHLVASHVVQDRFALRLAVQRHQGDGRGAGRIEGQHDGRQRAGRQLRDDGQGQRVDLRQGPAGILIAMKVVADDAGTEDRARFLPFHAVGLAGEQLHVDGDVFFHGPGRHAAVEGEHLHGRALENGQNVDRNAHRATGPPARQSPAT